MGNYWSNEAAKESSVTPPSEANHMTTEPASAENDLTPSESKHDAEDISNIACFGAGCYWGTEKFFKIDFARRRYPESLIRGQVGE